jgi:hypothetical protein
MESASMTDLLRDPRRVIRRLEKGSDIIVERRDGAPLRLTLSSRAQEEREGTAVLARVLVKALPELARLAWDPLVDTHPWLRFLPERERPVFLREFAETVEACATLDTNAPLARLLREWKATAEVHSDPVLAAALKRPSKGTKVRVPRPRPSRR